jgi:hypothetical protein
LIAPSRVLLYFSPLRKVKTLVFAIVPLFFFLALGCQSEDERADYYAVEGLSQRPTGGSQVVEVPSKTEYPAGPYATANPRAGDTLEDLTFYGFHRIGAGDNLVSESDYGEFSFSDYRESGAEYLLIHVAAAWCSSCLLGAIDLQFAASQVVAAGGELLELVIDGQGVGVDPLKEELELWAEYGGLTFSTSGPGRDKTRQVFPDREHVYVIDLDTMQVVWTDQGLYNNPSVAQLGLEQLLGDYLQE